MTPTTSQDSDNNNKLMVAGIQASDDTDGGIVGDISYQWQRCWPSDADTPCLMDDWVDLPEDISGSSGILGTSEVSIEIPKEIAGHTVVSHDLFRVKITYTDAQGYSTTGFSDPLGNISSGIRIRVKVFLEGPHQ